MIWEEGEPLVKKKYSKEALKGRSYVFDVIRRDPGPFLDMRRIQYPWGWQVYYRAEGTCGLLDYMKHSLYRGELRLSLYVKAMYQMLKALEAAEEKMIFASSFVVSGESLRYEPKDEAVKIMYIPKETEGENISLWKRESPGKLLLSLLDEMDTVDGGFRNRWPVLEQTYGEWKEMGAGRNRCMKEIRSWMKEL